MGEKICYVFEVLGQLLLICVREAGIEACGARSIISLYRFNWPLSCKFLIVEHRNALASALWELEDIPAAKGTTISLRPILQHGGLGRHTSDKLEILGLAFFRHSDIIEERIGSVQLRAFGGVEDVWVRLAGGSMSQKHRPRG